MCNICVYEKRGAKWLHSDNELLCGCAEPEILNEVLKDKFVALCNYEYDIVKKSEFSGGSLPDKQIYLEENRDKFDLLRCIAFSHPVFVVFGDSDEGMFPVIGCAELTLHTVPVDLFSNDAVLNWLWIDKEYRGQDIGTKLFEVITSYIKKAGKSSLRVSAIPTNPAIDFYRKMGFVSFLETMIVHV